MQKYQQEYIDNCQQIRALTATLTTDIGGFYGEHSVAEGNIRRAQILRQRNMHLLNTELMPILDGIFGQSDDTAAELEEFADALTKSQQTIDMPLAGQIHEALLSRARRNGSREAVIRELYKLGMARYGVYNLLTGMTQPSVRSISDRMRYCFIEASSYIKYFDEFDNDTKSYILRSFANIYLGSYDDWRDKLARVRHTMQVFTDERYRSSAPDLPWEAYMRSVHRQMITIIPHGYHPGELDPETVSDVMESSHILYDLSLSEALKTGDPTQAQNLFSYYSLEYRCGFISGDELLSHIEDLLDRADPTQYDSTNAYLMLSLPAFYMQYLELIPGAIPPRVAYINRITARAMAYIRAIPYGKATDAVRLFVRQALSKFIELDGGLTYRDLTVTLLAQFSSDVYVHGYVVGRMAEAVCDTILTGEPTFFDELPGIGDIADPAAKREAVLDLAYHTGLLHDVGKINFTSIYTQAGRHMMDIEQTMMQLHSNHGWEMLKFHDSTAMYADAAWGHHRWYDSSDGYPDDYVRKDSPYRAMVDVIALCDYLESDEDGDPLDYHMTPINTRIETARKLEGRRFSPLVTAWLRNGALTDRLRELYDNGRREGYLRCVQHIDG